MCAASKGESGSGVARLRCASLVTVVQAADLWNGDHTPRSLRRDSTWYGCILAQPEVRSCSRVVGDVLVQHAAKAGSRQHDDVIEALAPDRSDESFDVGVLPRGARRRQDFLNAHGMHMLECMITIAKEKPRHFVPGEGVAKLLHGPSGRGMFRDGDMNDAPAIMSEKHQDELGADTSPSGPRRSRPQSAAAHGWSRRPARSARAVADGGPCTWRRSFETR